MSFSHVKISIRQSSDLSNQNSIILIKALVNRKWTLEQKFVLCILVRWYIDSWNDKAMIFNAYFQDSTVRKTNMVIIHYAKNALNVLQLQEIFQKTFDRCELMWWTSRAVMHIKCDLFHEAWPIPSAVM